ncbi:unnamed protein product [Mycena citricolor]|uniref:Uncharacterized protein n=1 Tax=Mycena citricolor TaxID=2018698 RepID=A0AAD2Q5D1_9AGAR|nr:unnamed protein product [Mycena citricolor]
MRPGTVVQCLSFLPRQVRKWQRTMSDTVAPMWGRRVFWPSLQTMHWMSASSKSCLIPPRQYWQSSNSRSSICKIPLFMRYLDVKPRHFNLREACYLTPSIPNVPDGLVVIRKAAGQVRKVALSCPGSFRPSFR